MARGWESKGIEQQQEERLASNERSPHFWKPEEAATAREREGLRLRRSLVIRQLEDAQGMRRGQLQAALAELDAQLERLG